MSNSENILFIQNRIKFILNIKNKFSKKYNQIKNILYSLSNIIVNNYNNEIITQYIYTNNLSSLEELTFKFQNIKYNVSFKNILEENKKLNSINSAIINITKQCGINSLSSLLLLLDEKIDNEHLIDFINNAFNITEIDVQNKNQKQNKDKTNLTVYKDNDKNLQLNYDLKNTAHLKQYLFTKNLKKNLSFLESLNGCRVYIRCKNKNTIIILNGYFNIDQLNIYRNHLLFENKNNQLNEELTHLNINQSFKEAYLKQLSLKNFIILSINEIIDKIKNDYFNIINYKNKSLAVLVKEFLNKDINEQINFISMFLLFEEDPEIQNMSYLLYDMICNESYLLKPSADGNFIFSNIHWSLQKEFKVINKKFTNNIKQMENFTFEEVSYEKRIYLMKANNSVKQKAYDKLKEISNKSNDNSSKAVQYLDNLLKIPFGVYQKEEILNYYDKFVLNYILNIKKILKSDMLTYQNNSMLNDILNKKKIYYDEILLCNNYISSLNKNTQNLNSTTIKSHLAKKKKNQLEEILQILENNTSIQKNKKPKNKNEYIDKITNIFLNFDSNTQNKYINLIDIEIKKSDCSLINNLIEEFNIYNKTVSDYLNCSSKILDNAIYGQDEAKIEIKRIISQWINGENTGYCLGFEGPPGTGKTTIAKEGISNCLKDNDGKSRPFSFIALGGSTNGSTFEGHNYTYLGSTHGKIVDILIESKCMNPIIYIDELDKISNTENGKELIGILTHLTDSTQNEQFNDKYFSGIDFDLSKVLFIFSYNDYNKLDKILADRIHRIKFNYMSTNEKIIIMKNYLIPKLLKTVGIKELIVFNDEIISHIIENYTVEGGVRKLKEKIFEIIRQINLNLLNDVDYLNKLEAKNIYINQKIVLNTNIVDEILEKKPKVIHKKINELCKVGLINGLYATSAGTGGLTIIEAYKTFHETKLALIITGQQGDVMKESIQCAKTIAWNLLPDNIKKEIQEDLKTNSFGIHVHCPEAATPKDGPSAGTAITLTLLSLLSNQKILNNIAITGEINLNGEVLAVGGIDLKIEGGKKAGVNKILLPFENKDDFNVIKKSKPTIDENIEIIFIKTVWDTFEHIFVENSIEFNKF